MNKLIDKFNKIVTLSAKEERELLKSAKEELKEIEMRNKDYYAILNVDLSDSLAKIKQSYKKLAKKWHPDKNRKNQKEAKKKFQEINEAYEVLSKSKTRKKYHEKHNSSIENARAVRLLVHHNQNLVKYIVRGFSSLKGKVDPEDLVSEGVASLPKAIEKFDLDTKNRFATYAGYWIRQYIQSFINRNQLVDSKKNLLYYDSAYQSSDGENNSYSLADTLRDEEVSKDNFEEIRQNDISTQMNDAVNSLGDRKQILLSRLRSRLIPNNLLDIYYMADDEEKELIDKFNKIVTLSAKEELNKDYYAILNVDLSDSLAKIKQSYKKLAKKWHPDKNLDNIKEAEARMKEINEAYEVLSKSKTRKATKTDPEMLKKYSLKEVTENKKMKFVRSYLELFSKTYNFSDLVSYFGESESSVRKTWKECFKKLQEEVKKRKLHLLIEDTDLVGSEKDQWLIEKKDLEEEDSDSDIGVDSK